MSGRQAQPMTKASVVELIISTMREEFAEWVQDPKVRRVLRECIAGKVKRKALMELAYAKGFQDGAALMGEVKDREHEAARQRKEQPSKCSEPDCIDGAVHEDGEVSLCWSCGGPKASA